MNRRCFLTTAAVCTSAAALVSEEEKDRKVREYIQLRTIFAADAQQREKILETADSEAIPFLNGLGFPTVGVFSVQEDLHAGDKKFPEEYRNAVFMVFSSPTFEKLEQLHESFHTAPPAAPDGLFDENEQDTLLRAFPNCPKLAVPNLSPDRVVQLRCYASPSAERNRMKRNMFDIRGELDLFKRCGMLPVFFSETLYGGLMAPSLHYMLSFPNNDERLACWKKFVTSDEWKRMSVEPQFQSTATRIINLFLKPTKCSQV